MTKGFLFSNCNPILSHRLSYFLIIEYITYVIPSDMRSAIEKLLRKSTPPDLNK